MRTSNLSSVSLRLGSERKALSPNLGALGTGNSAARRAASGSMHPKHPVPDGKMLVGSPPEVAIGTPHRWLGYFRSLVLISAWLASKISPLYVLLPLQSSAFWAVGLPFTSRAFTGVLVSRIAEKFPPISSCVGTVDSCGSPWRMRRPS